MALLCVAPSWIIEMTAKGADAAYAKMRLWVDKVSGQAKIGCTPCRAAIARRMLGIL